MGHNGKGTAILGNNKQMQPMYSREIFYSRNKTKSKQKKGNLFIVLPQEAIFVTKLSVALTRKITG